MTFADTLESLRTALEAKTVDIEVLADAGSWPPPYIERRQDPAYAPLLALVRGEPGQGCPEYEACWMFGTLGKHEHRRGCLHQHARTADWEAAPEGALPGAVKVIAERRFREVESGTSRAFGRLELAMEACFYVEHPNQAAAAAMLKWVKEQP